MSFPARKIGVTLWIIQSLLAVLFLFAGAFKLAIPLATLAKVSPLPAPFLKFIGVCEVAGAAGLILPGWLHIKEWLTPLAALGLSIIMTGAVVMTVATAGIRPAITPLMAGLLAIAVALGRRARPAVAGTAGHTLRLRERPGAPTRRLAA
jgi:hypothetical protein